MASVFIDGEAGTTGLGIRERLASLPVTVRSIEPGLRKDAKARQALMAEVDVVVLCLPDAAAKEAAVLAEAAGKRVLDASSAHRVAPGWVYGFAELAAEQKDLIAESRLVSNPGCYATGAIALLRPLTDAGLIPRDFPISINAVSGYSGGGRPMIEAHEASAGPAFELYALGLDHKHVPETMVHAGLEKSPLFVPSVGHFRQGMLVSIPLHLDAMPGKPTVKALRAALAAHYAESGVVEVVMEGAPGRLEPESLNGTDRLELRVYGGAQGRQALLVARLDNLGKGASGAAVQNLGLMLGIEVGGHA